MTNMFIRSVGSLENHTRFQTKTLREFATVLAMLSRF